MISGDVPLLSLILKRLWAA